MHYEKSNSGFLSTKNLACCYTVRDPNNEVKIRSLLRKNFVIYTSLFGSRTVLHFLLWYLQLQAFIFFGSISDWWANKFRTTVQTCKELSLYQKLLTHRLRRCQTWSQWRIGHFGTGALVACMVWINSCAFIDKITQNEVLNCRNRARLRLLKPWVWLNNLTQCLLGQVHGQHVRCSSKGLWKFHR